MNEPPDADRAAFEEEARELRQMFVSARQADLARLGVAIAAGDFATVHAVGHVFRGSGATFGFPEASRLGVQLEEAAGRADGPSVRALADALAACLAPAP
ncbi:MAG: Hpt domain-containing protein [Betaproteobacteria bacterium]|nr:Hpt domain-containing protein [Betaproteobacteria bacterium]